MSGKEKYIKKFKETPSIFFDDRKVDFNSKLYIIEKINKLSLMSKYYKYGSFILFFLSLITFFIENSSLFELSVISFLFFYLSYFFLEKKILLLEIIGDLTNE